SGGSLSGGYARLSSFQGRRCVRRGRLQSVPEQIMRHPHADRGVRRCSPVTMSVRWETERCARRLEERMEHRRRDHAGWGA
ncbi:hypothetical protein HYPSUDRAFT_36184, partial [Hypholoma sublateritium FD-334 SS-4]